jgi:integrase
MATIINRDGRWQAKIRRQNHPLKTKTFALRAEAEAWARQVESEMDRGEWQDRRAAERMTLGEAITTWQTTILINLAKSTRAADDGRCAILQKDEIAKKALAKVTTTDVLGFMKRCEKAGRKPKTTFQYVTIISRVFNIARRLWNMPYLVNPVSMLPLERKAFLNKTSREARRLRGTEEARLLEACSEQMNRIVRFALATAMRRSEIADLRWVDVHIEERWALARDTKNGDDRKVPLSAVALNILREIGEPEDKADRKKFLFGISDARQITEQMIAACAKAKIEDLRFHDLRHEAISRLAALGRFSTVRLAAISGHKTVQMLAHYDHATVEELANAMDGV